jgi:hypothetical protein
MPTATVFLTLLKLMVHKPLMFAMGLEQAEEAFNSRICKFIQPLELIPGPVQQG